MVDHANNWWGAIADAIDEAFIATDEHDHVVAFNQAALKILHLSAQQVSDPGYWNSKELQPLQQLLYARKSFAGQEVKLTHCRLRVSGKPLITGTHNGYLLLFKDISEEYSSSLELEETKDQLEESQQIFKSVFDHSPTGIGLINADLTWGDVNESLVKTLGYSRDELKGQAVTSFVHPDDLATAQLQVSMLVDGKIETYRTERRYLHKNGQYIWVFLAVSHLLNADGTTRFFIIQMIDVTELKQLVTDAHKKNIILHATSVDLQQKIRQLKEFNSIIAHNLRGPATALIGSTDLLPDVTDERDRQLLLHHMKRTAGSILETLNDLKAILDMQENMEIPFLSCDLSAIVTQLWRLLDTQVVEKDASLFLDLAVPFLNYPRIYLENILRSLLNNALTYTRPGVKPEIEIASWQEDESTTVLMVRDNGIGIDLEKHRGQLFGYKKKFHRGYNSNGISLFMIRNQIRTFGGNVQVRSETGKGSSFYIYFNNRVRTLKQDEQD